MQVTRLTFDYAIVRVGQQITRMPMITFFKIKETKA